MRSASQFFKILVLVAVFTAAAVMAQTSFKADFETTSNGPMPSAEWAASATLVVQNGNIHSTATLLATKSLGVWNKLSNTNQVKIKWAAAGDGCDNDGTQYGGVVFMKSASITSDGYFVYFRNSKISLYAITSGTNYSFKADADASPAAVAGSEFLVKMNPATYSFEVFLNGSKIGTTLTDGTGAVNLSSTSYGGVMLYGAKLNDIEEITVINDPTYSGGSGGGTDPGGSTGGTTTGSWNCLDVDQFTRATVGDDWDAPNHVIDNNEFAPNPSRTTWTLGMYKKAGGNKSAGADSIKVSMNMGAGAQNYGTSGSIPLGFAVMMESPSYNSNGYFLRRASGKLQLYQITESGSKFTVLVSETATVARPTPAAGDKVTAIIKQTGTTATISYYINDVYDSKLTNVTLPTTPPATWYVGVVQYENGGNNSNIDNFQVCLPSLNPAGATRIIKVSGDGQTGAINQYLTDSLKVKVTDDANTAVGNVVLDFSVTQGRATLETGTFDGKIWKEVESGSLLIPIAKDTIGPTASVSGGHYIKTSYTSGYRYKTAVSIPIYVPVEQTYKFYLRYRTKSGSMNGVIFKYSDRDSFNVEVTDLSGNWAWHAHPTTFRLPKGLQTVRLVILEPGWDWDKIAIIASNVAGPSGSTLGSTGPNLSNVTNAQGFATARVKFADDADTNVVVSVTGYKADGTTLLDGAPVNFTLDATPGPASKIVKDPDLTDPILGTRDEVAGATIIAVVQDASGNAVPGTTVNWKLTKGIGGALASASSVSGADGRASVTMTLGLVDTLFEVEAKAFNAASQELTNSPLYFNIKTGKPPTSMEKVSGDGQSGDAGATLPNPLKVRVLGANSTPYANYPVTFTVTAGDGKVSPQSPPNPQTSVKVITDTNGEAWVYWTLGNKTGTNTVQARLQGLASIPAITFSATGNTGAARILAIVSGDGQTGPVGLAVKDSMVVKVTDAVDNPIAGKQIDFVIVDGTDAYLDEVGQRTRTKYTNASGRASVRLTMGSSVNEVNRVRASVTDANITPQNVTFQATATTAIAAKVQYVSGNDQDTTVTAKLGKPFVVQVFGPFGSAISNHPVRFKVVKGGGNFDGMAEKVVNSDANGLAQATLTLGKTAGDSTNVVEVVSYRQDQPTVLLEGAPIRLWAHGNASTASKLVKLASTDNQQAPNGRELSLPLKALVTDVHGNAIKNYPVTFQVEGAGGTIIDDTGETTVKVIMTGNDGYATVRWKMPVALGVFRMRVDAMREDGAALTDSPAYFTATSITGDAWLMVKWNTPDTLLGTVDKVVSRKVRVRVTDANTLPKGGYMVSFSVTQGNGKVNNQTMVTVPTSADSGIAEVSWLLGTTSGIANNVLEVRSGVVNGFLQVFKATAAPDVPYQLVPDAATNNQLGNVGETLSKAIRVQIKDKYGNGVPGTPVSFHVSGVDSLRGNIEGAVEKSVNSDVDGYASVSWTLGKRPGTKNNALEVAARHNSVNLLNSPFIFYASAMVGSPRLILMASDTTKFTGIIGNQLSERLKARVTDQFKNPIANHSVTFEVMSKNEANGGSLDGATDVKKSLFTDSNGLVSVQFTLGKNSGNKINRVEARAEHNGAALSGSPVVYLISAAPSNAYSINYVDAGDKNRTGTVGKYVQNELKVIAYDRYGNVVKGHPIQFRVLVGASDNAALGADTLLTKVVDTGVDGIARVSWRLGRKAGADRNVVEASSSNGTTALENSPLQFVAVATPDITDGKRSTIQAVDAVVNADGVSKATIKVSLKDRYDNAVTGKYVTLLPGDPTSAMSITQPLNTTDVNGDAIGYVSSTKAGRKWIEARDVNSGVNVADSVAVTFLALPAYEIARTGVNDGDAQTRNIGTALPLPLRVMVRDMFGNPIAGHPVTFVPTQGGGSMLDPQVMYTDSTGIASARYRLGNQAGVNFVEARASKGDGSALNNSPVRFTEIGVKSQPSRLVIVDGENQKAAPGQQLSELLRVKLVDINGYPIYGETVRFGVLVNNGAITSNNPVVTDMEGMASAQATSGTQSGSTLFSAYLPSYSAISAVTFTVSTEITPDRARKLVYVSGSDQTGTVGRTLYNPLAVRVEDAYGNAVSNVPVSFLVVDDASTKGKGTLDGGRTTLSVLSDAQGIAMASYTLGTNAGLNKVRASGTNLQPTFIEFLVTGSADYPYCMEKMENPNLYGQVGKRMVFPIQILVKDQYGNPARGGLISFVVVPGSGNIDGSAIVTSDASGIASAYWVLGKQGTNEALATASMPCGAPMARFYARGDVQNYPEFALVNSYTINEGEQLCFDVKATDIDGDQVYYSSSNLPEGASFEMDINNVYRFCWTPTYEQGGHTFTPVFTAQDNRGGIDIDSVKIQVVNDNRAPRIVTSDPTADFVNMTWGQTKTFTIQAEDPDNDQIYYSWKVNDQVVSSATSFVFDTRYYQLGNYIINVDIYDIEHKINKVWVAFVTSVSVEMKSFSALPTDFDGVTVKWATASESDNLGFNVLRSRQENGTYDKINREIIAARPDGIYSYSDQSVKAGERYFYKLEDISRDGQITLHGPVSAQVLAPETFELSQNYPNPFNPTTTIRFQLPSEGKVLLQIFNTNGQLIRTLVDAQVRVGFHQAVWDGKNDSGIPVVTGVYYYRIIANGTVMTKKMALLK